MTSNSEFFSILDSPITSFNFQNLEEQKDSFNWYAYCNNDPINYIDPLGLEDVYFLYTYKNTEHDQKLKRSERWSINDDIKELQKQGFTVKVDEDATLEDVEAAFSDPEAKLIVTSGHGYDDGTIQTSDGKSFGSTNISGLNVSENLQTVILENCHQGDFENEWESALNNKTDVVGWNGTMTNIETASFNSIGAFDRQDKKLSDYINDITPDEIVPDPTVKIENYVSVPKSASKSGGKSCE